MIAEAWLAVAIMMGVHSDGMQDILVFKQPKHGHFHSVTECADFVNKNPEPLSKQCGSFMVKDLLKELCVFVERILKKSWHNEIV